MGPDRSGVKQGRGAAENHGIEGFLPKAQRFCQSLCEIPMNQWRSRESRRTFGTLPCVTPAVAARYRLR